MACRHVPQIQTASASAMTTVRNPAPESSGKPASFWAICAWNGLIGLNAAPTAAAPTLIAAAVMASNPSCRVTSSSTGTSAMISSPMFSSAPPAANVRLTIGMTSASRD